MDISRRDFLKYCIGSAAALGLSSPVVSTLSKALAGEISLPEVIWIEGAGCSGCSMSLLNLIGGQDESGPKDIHDLLASSISLVYSQIIMAAAGDQAVANLRRTQKNGFILVVEGAIPTAFDGMTCTLFSENGEDYSMLRVVKELAPQAKAVLCVGACACFGGIPASEPNPTGIKTLKELTGISPVNIAGCPAHPDWVAGTVATLLCGGRLDLDEDGRPLALYGKSIHARCPRRPFFDNGVFAAGFGEEGHCLYSRGCKGPQTKADCPVRGWNNGAAYCISTNGNCIGCVEKTFPSNPLLKR